MFPKCNFAIRIALTTLVAVGLGACETNKSRNPLSPNVAGPIEGVAISVPTQMTPAGGQLVQADEQPIVLTFAAATSNGERPFWYEVEIATDGGFGNVVHASDRITPHLAGTTRSSLEEAAGSAAETYRVPVTLDADKTYHWHVRAADGANAGPFSNAAQFEIFTPVTIRAPRPIFPVDGEAVSSLRPSIKVASADVTGPATEIKYRFEIATDAGFANPVAVATVSPGGRTTQAMLGGLSWNTRYKWRAQVSANGREGRVSGPWSATKTFRTPEVPIGLPIPVSPINGATTSSRRPTLVVRNGATSRLAGNVRFHFQISKNSNFNNTVASFNVPQASESRTSATAAVTLAAKTTYYWRARATDGSFNTGFGTPARFKTPAGSPPPTGGSPAPSGGSPPPAPFCCPPPNRFEIVQQVAAETGYPQSGMHVTNFTQIVAERLAREDPNWGRRINDAGPLGKDTVAYRINGQNNNPFSIDIVNGATGPNPKIHWNEHGSIGGVWTPAR